MKLALVTIATALGLSATACTSGDRALATPEVTCGGAALVCQGRGPLCCWSPAAGTGSCVADGGVCTDGGILLACDGEEDCVSGQVCCLARDGSRTSCEARSSCALLVVHPPCDCPLGGCCLPGPAGIQVCSLVGCGGAEATAP